MQLNALGNMVDCPLLAHNVSQYCADLWTFAFEVFPSKPFVITQLSALRPANWIKQLLSER